MPRLDWPEPTRADANLAAAGINGDLSHGLPPKVTDMLTVLAYLHHHPEDGA